MTIKQKIFVLLLVLIMHHTFVIANAKDTNKANALETNRLEKSTSKVGTLDTDTFETEQTRDSKMERHHNINYLEIPSKDIDASKTFFSAVFGWTFIDYGPEYSSFTARGIDGGFFTSKGTVSTKTGSPLIVLYSAELEATQIAVEQAGGAIIEAIFSFPGGRRFHFTDTTGNEYAVWSE